MSSIYESNVDPLRPNDAHGISLQLIGREKKVLELGAASGHVTRALKGLGHTVTAVERDGRFKDELSRIADEAFITDLDWLDLRQVLCGQTFDVILAGDVLEHCVRPDLVLRECHHLLAPGGYVVISLPNIAHADVRLALLAGRFRYRDTGLLDRTHLRFFTRETIEDFVRTNGFRVDEIHASTAPLGMTELGVPDPSIPREAIDFVQKDRDHTVYQYILRVTPVGPTPTIDAPLQSDRNVDRLLAELGQSYESLAYANATGTRHSDEMAVVQNEMAAVQNEMAAVQAELERSRTREHQMEERLERAARDITESAARADSLEVELILARTEVLHARDNAIGSAAELGVLRARHAKAQSEVDSLINQLNLLHTSRTWRIGRFVLLPLRAVRWVLHKLMS